MNTTPDLDTNGASDYLRDTHGVCLKPSTLAFKRTHGGGPRFYRIGRKPQYTVAALDEYVESLRSNSFESTAAERGNQ